MNNFCLCNEYVIVIGFEWYKRTKGNRINRFPLAIVRKVRAIVHISVFRALYLWKSTAFSFVATPSCLPW